MKYVCFYLYDSENYKKYFLNLTIKNVQVKIIHILFFKDTMSLWLTLLILATWEAEIRRIQG
jgi:hypothetical protein